MVSRNWTLCVPAIVCALLPASLHGDERERDEAVRDRNLKLLDAASDLKMRELEYAVSKHAIEEAEVEIGKAKANLNSIRMRAHAGSHEDKGRIEFATLEQKQAQIRAEMKKLHSEMTQVRLELAQARFDHLKMTLTDEPKREPLPVRFEVVDDLDAIVIRGSKEGVTRMKSLIERSVKR